MRDGLARAVFARRTALCWALNLRTSYDQLNMPALASAEALSRLRMLIEMAHQSRPEAPSYAGAEEVLGVRDTADGSVIDPALTAHGQKTGRQGRDLETAAPGRGAAEEQRFIKNADDEKGHPKGGGRGAGRGAPKDEK